MFGILPFCLASPDKTTKSKSFFLHKAMNTLLNNVIHKSYQALLYAKNQADRPCFKLKS